MHGVGVVRPGFEVLSEDGELLLEWLDVCWVLVEEDLDLVGVSVQHITLYDLIPGFRRRNGGKRGGNVNVQFQPQP